MLIPQKLESVYQLLRATLGVMSVAVGADKFVGLLADWRLYLAPELRDLLGGGAVGVVATAGVVELLIGIALLSGATRVFGYVLCGWFVVTACNLLIGGWYDIAVRDLALAATAFSLARLATARREPLRAIDRAAPPPRAPRQARRMATTR
ncbi:MAG: hypothetical protein M9894_01890 [Planctomycetes bacterium]|nr:hypothetical protein [Planctomycetota bacterium]